MDSRASSSSFNNTEQNAARSRLDAQAAAAGQAGGGGVGRRSWVPGAAIGGAPGDAMLAQMASEMIRDFEVMERDQQGYSTTNGLFAIINALGRCPAARA